MNIVFLSEQNFVGKVPEDHTNMRTEFGWMKMLDAVHLPYNVAIDEQNDNYALLETADLVLLIPSKSHPEALKVGLILSRKGFNIGLVQEGPATFWQTWPVDYQVLYLGLLKGVCNIVLCHNEYDRRYFKGLTSAKVLTIPTVNEIGKWEDERIDPDEKRNIVFLGGNVSRWYRGMDSYVVAINDEVDEITFPSMGRKQDDEEEQMRALDERVDYVPYMDWTDFMHVLKSYKVGVHMMDEIAAGSFSLNCAMLVIPCIGNKNIDTQRICFPELSVDSNDMLKAKLLMNKLLTDEEFYNSVRDTALEQVQQFDVNNHSELIEKIEKEINAD